MLAHKSIVPCLRAAWLVVPLFFGVLLVGGTASAVGTRRFVLEQGADFKGGDLTGVAVDSGGQVLSGFDLGQVSVDGTPVVWCALPRSDGSVWLGTGNEGKILVLQDGRVRTLQETGGLLVSSLVEGWDGGVFASVVPGGAIVQVNATKVSPFVTLPQDSQIWQLAYDRKRQVLYAATGPEGKLYRIDRQKNVSVYFDAPEEHLLAVAVAADGSLVTGGSDKARLYRLEGPGRATTLYDFGRTEVRAIAMGKHGEVYAIANDIRTAGTGSSRRGSSGAASSSSTPASSSRPKGKGTLVRISQNGVPEILLDDDSEHFTSLAIGKDGQPYVGTGVEGRVYSVLGERRSVLVADTAERQITALLFDKNPLVIASDPAVIHPIRGRGGQEAVFTSKPLDAGLRALFGRLSWDATRPLELSTRTGNTKEPDDTWSEWSAPMRTPSRVSSPPGRFVQIRAKWSLDPNAILTRVELPFVTDNQRAVITRIEATGGGLERGLSDGIVSSGGPIASGSKPEVSLEWSIDNPDKDALRYRLYYRLADDNTWYDLLPSDEILSKSSWKWDTSTLPEGRYRLRVVATDELSNPPERVTRHELESGVFLVDNTPPTLPELELVGQRLRGRAVDGLGPVARIEVSIVGTGLFIPVYPTDQVFDEPSESFDVDLGQMVVSGRGMLVVRVYDAANNVVVRNVKFP